MKRAVAKNKKNPRNGRGDHGNHLFQWAKRGWPHAWWLLKNLGWCAVQVVFAKHMHNLL